MTNARKSPFRGLREASLARQAAVLSLAVAVICAGLAPIASQLSGRAGLAAVVLAAGSCLLGAEAALLVSRLDLGGDIRFGVLLGAFPRMGIPLSVGVVAQTQGGSLAEAGVLIYFLVFYPVTLGLGTFMSLPQGEVRVPKNERLPTHDLLA